MTQHTPTHSHTHPHTRAPSPSVVVPVQPCLPFLSVSQITGRRSQHQRQHQRQRQPSATADCYATSGRCVLYAHAPLPHLLPRDASDRSAHTPSLASPRCAVSHSAIPFYFPILFFTLPVSFCHRLHFHVFCHRIHFPVFCQHIHSTCFLFSSVGICWHLCSSLFVTFWSLLSYLASAFNAALALFHSLCSLVLACPGFSQRPAFRVRFHRRLTTSTRARRCDRATTARVPTTAARNASWCDVCAAGAGTPSVAGSLWSFSAAIVRRPQPLQPQPAQHIQQW